MSLPRFFVPAQRLRSRTFELGEKESRHALKVLRLGDGDRIELFDGEGNAFGGRVTGRARGRLLVCVEEALPARDPGVRVTLGISVIKPDRMEWLIEKASELGASGILPVLSQRSVIRISRERWPRKIERWQKIARETCKQCGRSQAPVVGPAQDFRACVQGFGGFDRVLIPTLAVQGRPLKSVLDARRSAKNILALIGPEGDFTPQEAALAVAAGAEPVSLGKLVLRSETAAVYLTAALNFAFFD